MTSLYRLKTRSHWAWTRNQSCNKIESLLQIIPM